MHRADVRILLATHRDLEDMVRLEAFRKDLYYRIRQIQIMIPPLRERTDDLAGLARDILERESAGAAPALGEELEELARAYPWPGNIRELQQALIAARAMSGSSTIGVEHLQAALGLGTMSSPEVAVDESDMPPPEASMEDIERWHIRRAVKAHGGNVSAAARSLGINRSTIYRRLLRD